MRTRRRQICGPCSMIPPAFDDALIPFRYAMPVDYMVQALKYNGEVVYSRVLGSLLASAARDAGVAMPDCLIPLPLHPSRFIERGFNQAAKIARFCARELSLPIDERLLCRIRATDSQVELSKAQRKKNVDNAFTVGRMCNYRHVAIVDDVVTTAATVQSAALTLRRAGIEHVSVWAVARADH